MRPLRSQPTSFRGHSTPKSTEAALAGRERAHGNLSSRLVSALTGGMSLPLPGPVISLPRDPHGVLSIVIQLEPQPLVLREELLLLLRKCNVSLQNGVESRRVPPIGTLCGLQLRDLPQWNLRRRPMYFRRPMPLLLHLRHSLWHLQN